MALNFSSLLKIVAPKKAAKGGTAATATFNPQQTDQVLTVPRYQDHLTDIFTSRQADNARVLMKSLFVHDPDVSAAVFSYLTLANTEPVIIARDLDQKIDRDATRELLKAWQLITESTDYTLGFQAKRSIYRIGEELRYMALLRGGCAAELVLDQKLAPSEIRIVDLASIEWFEKKPGEFKPQQVVPGLDKPVPLDIPTFWTAFFRRDPTEIYTNCVFVASINTIAARQQVINDLYRIMQRTGYPRLAVKVLEEVLRKNAPATAQQDQVEMRNWLEARMAEIRNALTNLTPDQAIVHFDAVEPSMINERMPGVGIDISAIIETLNAQNQAGLKTMSTVIGRGTMGVNTSSVEARIAAMNADELNEPVAEILQRISNFLLHQAGFQGFAEVWFTKAELRPMLELEPQQTLRAARLRKDLSDGLISDDEYHLMLYNRLPPEGVPDLAGTGFETAGAGGDLPTPSGNDDPLGRSLQPEGSDAAQSDGVTQ